MSGCWSRIWGAAGLPSAEGFLAQQSQQSNQCIEHGPRTSVAAGAVTAGAVTAAAAATAVATSGRAIARSIASVATCKE